MAKHKVIEPVPVPVPRKSLPLHVAAAGLAAVLLIFAVGFALIGLNDTSDKADKIETNLGYVQNDVNALEGKVDAMQATQSTILQSLLDGQQAEIKYRPRLHRRRHRR